MMMAERGCVLGDRLIDCLNIRLHASLSIYHALSIFNYGASERLDTLRVPVCPVVASNTPKIIMDSNNLLAPPAPILITVSHSSSALLLPFLIYRSLKPIMPPLPSPRTLPYYR